MVAVVSQKGMMFKGLINYLYDGKLEKRGAINKKAKVIIYSDNLRIPYGVEDKVGRNRLIEDFIDQAKSHKNYGDFSTKYVGEHILSFKKGEVEQLGKEKLTELCQQYVIDSGLSKTQYLAVSHGDTDIFHIHLVFNRCQNDKTLYPEWKEKMKAAERAVALSLKFNLALTGNQEKLANTKGVWEARVKHEDVIELSNNPMLKEARNVRHLEKLCEAKGIPFSKNDEQIKIGNDSFRVMDLVVIFFMNRQKNSDSKEKKEYKTQEFGYNKEKKNRISAHEIKKNKVENNRDEPNKIQNECKVGEENTPLIQNSTEEFQDFNHKKAWGKSDKDENLILKKRKKW